MPNPKGQIHGDIRAALSVRLNSMDAKAHYHRSRKNKHPTKLSTDV
jgi:hypothetical protein